MISIRVKNKYMTSQENQVLEITNLDPFHKVVTLRNKDGSEAFMYTMDELVSMVKTGKLLELEQ